MQWQAQPSQAPALQLPHVPFQVHLGDLLAATAKGGEEAAEEGTGQVEQEEAEGAIGVAEGGWRGGMGGGRRGGGGGGGGGGRDSALVQCSRRSARDRCAWICVYAYVCMYVHAFFCMCMGF